jgi:hypothetical protein
MTVRPFRFEPDWSTSIISLSFVLSPGTRPTHRHTRLKNLARDKHSSLLRISINYVLKSFITLTKERFNILKLYEKTFNSCKKQCDISPPPTHTHLSPKFFAPKYKLFVYQII